MPLPALSKDEKAGRVAAAEAEAAKAERQEHWRLLYVAMTRAEEALFIGGALGAREAEPAADSWYARLATAVWMPCRSTIRCGAGDSNAANAHRCCQDSRRNGHERPPVPDWAITPIGPEPRPPRPLAPSAAGQDEGADPPFPPGSDSFAARRGVLIHRLLERLPEVAAAARARSTARDWLARQAREVGEGEREAMLAPALAVLEEPGWAEIFGPDALAEVPLAATVGGAGRCRNRRPAAGRERPRAGGRFQDRAAPACQAWPRCRSQPCGRWRPMPRRWQRSTRAPDRGGACSTPRPRCWWRYRPNCSLNTSRRYRPPQESYPSATVATGRRAT